MTRNQIASKLAKAEGGKSQAKIGDIRELLRRLVYMDAEEVHAGGQGMLHHLMTESDAIVQEMIIGGSAKKAAKKVARKK